jgi:hypothetical protein
METPPPAPVDLSCLLERMYPGRFRLLFVVPQVSCKQMISGVNEVLADCRKGLL